MPSAYVTDFNEQPRQAPSNASLTLGKMLFQESSTDMAMSQAVVLYDVYKDGFAPVRAQYDFHKTFPDRTLFCGGVDPAYPSVAAACDEMERQVKEWGAVSFKFYTGHLEGKSWR